jgi:hypothetical protein
VERGVTASSARPVSAFAQSVRVTGRLLTRRQLRQPSGNVGRELAFADGTTSRVFRETVQVGAPTADPALLVVRFQLRAISHSLTLHALFRIESTANTPLFAGFPGFRSKLWATDLQTGVYRGIYQWDGAERATYYAATLVRLLRPVCLPGSVDFHVEPGIRRDDFLRDPRVVAPAGGDTAPAGDGWWRLRTGVET